MGGPGVGGGEEAYAEFDHVGADAGAEGGFAGDGAAGAVLGGFMLVEGDLGRREGGGEGEEEGGCAEGTWKLIRIWRIGLQETDFKAYALCSCDGSYICSYRDWRLKL